MTSTFLDIPWKVDHLGAIQWILKGKQTVFRSAGGKERWLNEESMNGGQCGLKKDNHWKSTFRSHRGQYCSKTFHDLVNSSSNWKQRCTWRAFHYHQLGLPSETWLWLLTDVIRWVHLNEHRKMHTTKTDCGTIFLNLKCALHRMNMGDEHHWWCQRISFHDLIWQAERNPWRRTLSLQRWAFYCKVWDPCMDDLTVPRRLVIT